MISSGLTWLEGPWIVQTLFVPEPGILIYNRKPYVKIAIFERR